MNGDVWRWDLFAKLSLFAKLDLVKCKILQLPYKSDSDYIKNIDKVK
jgi:hypothetical protein